MKQLGLILHSTWCEECLMGDLGFRRADVKSKEQQTRPERMAEKL